MRLEISITVCTVLVALRVLDFMILKLLFGSEADIARHALVDFDLYFSSRDGPAGGAHGGARTISSRNRYQCSFVVRVRVVGIITTEIGLTSDEGVESSANLLPNNF